MYAVRWTHEIAGINSPAECSLVKQVLGACKRALGKPVKGKQSVNVDLVAKVAEKFNTPWASTLQHSTDLRNGFFLLFFNYFFYFFFFKFIRAFAGLMRCDEIIRVNRRDVSIFPDHMSIFCLKRKNDQRSQGHYCYFERSGKITFPSLKKFYLSYPIIQVSL